MAKRRRSDNQQSSTPIAEPHTLLRLRLPLELFDMILDYFPKIPEKVILRNRIGVAPKYGERGKVLRALSKTSRLLRNAYLSLAWEHLDGCVIYPEATHGVWFKQVSKRLERVSKGLMKCPHLVQHVRVATVTLTRCSKDTVLPAFAQCLEILPNLHTLQIIHAHSQTTTALKTWFEHKRYPQIRTIILPSCAHNVLRACSEVTRVVCIEDDGGKLVSAIGSDCKKVEVLHGIRPSANIAKRLVKAAPLLKELEITTYTIYRNDNELLPSDIKILQNFKQLSSLTIRLERNFRKEKKDALIQAAREAIQNSSFRGEKVFLNKYAEPQN